MPLAKSKISAPYLAEFVQMVVLGSDRWMRHAKEDDYVASQIKAHRRVIEGLFYAAQLNKVQAQVLRFRLGLDKDDPRLQTIIDVQLNMNLQWAFLLSEVQEIERTALDRIFETLGINPCCIRLD